MLDYPISFYSINAEMGLAQGTPISLTDANVRRLADKPTGPVSLSDLVGVQEYTITVGKHSTLDAYGTSTSIEGGDSFNNAFGALGLSSNPASQAWWNGWGVRSLSSAWDTDTTGGTYLVLTMPPGQVPTFSSISIGAVTLYPAGLVEQRALPNGDAYYFRWRQLLVTAGGAAKPGIGSQLRMTLRR
ncbi:hypothetical protein [Cupriavidus basilensis]|uniref:hypothetical protein n=1 Tax=Cupriavidus basilensis TaxID=68895 RepID=UPI0020A6C944|nr:hypothetical protein [Cupriavidus basilensis]MCP3023257.1 hypothetical protein [Cupriavidus basilensis]